MLVSKKNERTISDTRFNVRGPLALRVHTLRGSTLNIVMIIPV